MTNAERIRAIREAQQEAARSGQALSYRDAKRQLAEAKPANELAHLKNEVATLKAKLDGIRITGPGHSGQGPTGLRFNPDEANAGGGGGPTSAATIPLLDIIESGIFTRYTLIPYLGTRTEF